MARSMIYKYIYAIEISISTIKLLIKNIRRGLRYLSLKFGNISNQYFLVFNNILMKLDIH